MIPTPTAPGVAVTAAPAPAPGADPFAPDRRLARRVVAGERAAFDAFYETYFARIHAYARRRARERAEAEDWTQDALVQVLQSLPAYRGDAPLAAFVFAIVRRVVIRARRGPPASVPLDAAGDAPSPEPSPEARAHDRALLRRVELVWSRAGRSARAVLALRFGHDLSPREIAERTGASEAAVKTALARARRRLAEVLGPLAP